MCCTLSCVALPDSEPGEQPHFPHTDMQWQDRAYPLFSISLRDNQTVKRPLETKSHGMDRCKGRSILLPHRESTGCSCHTQATAAWPWAHFSSCSSSKIRLLQSPELAAAWSDLTDALHKQILPLNSYRQFSVVIHALSASDSQYKSGHFWSVSHWP